MSVGSPTVIEAAPTEFGDAISISSSNDGDAGVVAVIAAPPLQGGWAGRITRFASVMRASNACSIVLWDLPAFSLADDSNAQYSHCKGVIDCLLTRGYIAGFKIGITYLPFDRGEAYKLEGYKELRVMAVHDDADRIKDLERRLVAAFRRYGPGGQFVSDGHCLCRNRNPGGESGDHGLAPFCCYVASA